MKALNDIINENHHVLICGETGSGKTTLAKHIYRVCAGYGVFLNIQDEEVSGLESQKWDRSILQKSKKFFLT